MGRKVLLAAILAAVLAGIILWSPLSDPPPVGIEQREPWTTSRVHGTPDPPDPFTTEVVFPEIRFEQPLEVTTVPGTNLIAVAERYGKIYVFENRPGATEKHLLMDVGKTIYGLEFHPEFQENRYFFVSQVDDPVKELPEGSQLSRYRANPGQPLTADRDSETVLLIWPSGGHNGGCIRFGPDGNLYLGTGDASGIADSLVTGQNPDDLMGSILRIDVDRPDAGKNYGIPPDNPYVGREEFRPEVWAYGLRQPWKFSFDPARRLWVGEIGQDLWEMIHIIEKGGNYGWSVMEATHPFRPDRPLGPTPILAPLVEHSHTDFRSITGGYVYQGSRIDALAESYIYGDHDTGKIWSLDYDGTRVENHRQLADTLLRIVAIGQDQQNELMFLDFIGGQLHRLMPRPESPRQVADFPLRLSETGLFTSTEEMTPAPGLIPYSVNAALWSDHAAKERYIALPGLSQIEYDTVIYPQPAPGVPPGWKFPDGTVLVKTFSLETERGNPESLRRLETRLLHHERIPGTDEVGAQVWKGYVYVWNEEQTDAHLLESEGLDRPFSIREADGGTSEQTWRFPSRAECTLCHTTAAKYVLGVNTLQMNKDHDYGGVVANQLRTLDHLGVFTKPLPVPPEKLGRLADYQNPDLETERRARSYLHANCSHCHVKWGGGNADFQLIGSMPLEQTGIVDTLAAHGRFELDQPRLVVPGHPDRSVIPHRMAMLGLGRMPHIASNVVDEEGVRLVREWIRSLPVQQSRNRSRDGNGPS